MLFTPGPTPVPESIRHAMSQPTLHHRTKEFEAIFASAREKLFALYGMDEVLMFASSGSGAMEACVVNLCKEKALVVNAGKFGERFGKICRRYGKETIELKYEWDTPADAKDVTEAAIEQGVDALFIQVSESAGGLRHPVEEIAALIKKQNSDIMVIADGITAVGVEAIDTSNIDALISGSQKAYMLPPGLAIVGLGNEAIERAQVLDAGFYFNFLSEIKNQRKNTTAWTAATTIIIGLDAVLDAFFEKGLEQLYKETEARASATRKALGALGLRIYPKAPANSMSTLFHERSEEIRSVLKEHYGCNVAGGQEHLKGTIFRINHMGLVEPYEAAWVVNAVELALDMLDIRKFDGQANAIYLQEFYSRMQL